MLGYALDALKNGLPSEFDFFYSLLGQACLHGMARVIKSECPNIPLSMIDLCASPSDEEKASLYEELTRVRYDLDESEIALKKGERFVRRLFPLHRDKAEKAATIELPASGGHYKVDKHRLNDSNQSHFCRVFESHVGEHEVEIAVVTAAMNFKDVINLMEILPKDAVLGGLTADRLGLEVAGIVLRIGNRVTHVKEGDTVIARVVEGFRGRVITAASYVFKKPECLSFAESGSPSLSFLGRLGIRCSILRALAEGEMVLIHSAAGGVGGAAIQIAQRAGAQIIATAGTKEKREYLTAIGHQTRL